MREPKVFCIIGGRGSGKTYFLENLLPKDNTVIFELVKTNRWDGFRKYFFEEYEQGKVPITAIANKKIVFEDATSYVSSNMKNTLKTLIVYSKQIGSDVYIVFHSVNIIPPFLWNLVNYLILFKCAAPRQTALNADYFPEIHAKWKKLQKAKQYTHYEIETQI